MIGYTFLGASEYNAANRVVYGATKNRRMNLLANYEVQIQPELNSALAQFQAR